MSQRYCRHCGAELKAGAKYCSECGRETDAATRHGERSKQRSRTDDHSHTGGHTARTHDEGPDETLAALTHILGLLSWVVGPLIVYVVTEDEYARENAANATNWQIMFTLYMLVSIPLVLVLVGLVLLLILPALNLGFCIIAAVKANEGETWSYPLTPEFL